MKPEHSSCSELRNKPKCIRQEASCGKKDMDIMDIPFFFLFLKLGSLKHPISRISILNRTWQHGWDRPEAFYPKTNLPFWYHGRKECGFLPKQCPSSGLCFTNVCGCKWSIPSPLCLHSSTLTTIGHLRQQLALGSSFQLFLFSLCKEVLNCYLHLTQVKTNFHAWDWSFELNHMFNSCH